MNQISRPSTGTPITCLVDGHKHSGRVVRFEDASGLEPSKVVLAVADDGYTNHVSFPESSIVICPKCNNTGMLIEAGFIEKGFCDCPAGQDLNVFLTNPHADDPS